MKTRIEKIEEFLGNLDTEIDVLNYVDAESIEDFDDIYDQIQDNGGFDIDIIYYATAMEYLAENDTSLYDSMQLAAEMGYEIENLNSELLASLLASSRSREEFNSLETEIDEFFSELED